MTDSVRVTYDDDALREIRESIARIAERVDDPRIVWDPVIEQWLEDEREIFRTRGASIGTPWPPISKRATQGRRVGKRVRRSDKPLELTGRSRRALTEPKAAGAIRSRGRNAVKLGVRRGPLSIHQSGTEGGRIPARPVMGTTPEHTDRYVRIVASAVFDEEQRLTGGLL